MNASNYQILVHAHRWMVAYQTPDAPFAIRNFMPPVADFEGVYGDMRVTRIERIESRDGGRPGWSLLITEAKSRIDTEKAVADLRELLAAELIELADARSEKATIEPVRAIAEKCTGWHPPELKEFVKHPLDSNATRMAACGKVVHWFGPAAMITGSAIMVFSLLEMKNVKEGSNEEIDQRVRKAAEMLAGVEKSLKEAKQMLDSIERRDLEAKDILNAVQKANREANMSKSAAEAAAIDAAKAAEAADAAASKAEKGVRVR